jgi:hypothetical protein
MAIPQGRMSTTLVDGTFLEPEDRVIYANKCYERGPLAINDTSQGMLYQSWTFTYNPVSNEIVGTPETAGAPVVILTIPGITYFTATFDQNARITISYMTAVSSYLYWYDTDLPGTVTTDLGSDVITPSVYLDDKRDSQNAVNDMILWYTKDAGGGLYNLYNRLQRDRFLTEYPMSSGITHQYLRNVGITDENRIQLKVGDTFPLTVAV